MSRLLASADDVVSCEVPNRLEVSLNWSVRLRVPSGNQIDPCLPKMSSFTRMRFPQLRPLFLPLQKLGLLISAEIGREKFLECSVEAAQELLNDQNRYPESTKEFRRCLEDFGHRGYNEFDIYRKSWDMDPSPLITTLQTLSRSRMDGTPKIHESVFQSIRAMNCRLTLWQKLVVPRIRGQKILIFFLHVRHPRSLMSFESRNSLSGAG